MGGLLNADWNYDKCAYTQPFKKNVKVIKSDALQITC